MLMCPETPAHSLNVLRLDVVLPAFCLHGHPRSDDIANNECASHVDAAVFGKSRYLGLVEPESDEKPLHE